MLCVFYHNWKKEGSILHKACPGALSLRPGIWYLAWTELLTEGIGNTDFPDRVPLWNQGSFLYSFHSYFFLFVEHILQDPGPALGIQGCVRYGPCSLGTWSSAADKHRVNRIITSVLKVQEDKPSAKIENRARFTVCVEDRFEMLKGEEQAGASRAALAGECSRWRIAHGQSPSSGESDTSVSQHEWLDSEGQIVHFSS